MLQISLRSTKISFNFNPAPIVEPLIIRLPRALAIAPWAARVKDREFLIKIIVTAVKKRYRTADRGNHDSAWPH